MIEIQHRPLSIDQYDDYYHLKCDPVNVAWSGFLTAPNYEHFKEYFASFLGSCDKYLALFYIGDQCVGYSVLRYLANNVCDISYGVHHDFSGRGISNAIHLRTIEIVRNFGCTSLQTYISEKNIASCRSVLRAGYSKTEVWEIRDVPLIPGVHQFYKYVREL